MGLTTFKVQFYLVVSLRDVCTIFLPHDIVTAVIINRVIDGIIPWVKKDVVSNCVIPIQMLIIRSTSMKHVPPHNQNAEWLDIDLLDRNGF